MFSPRVPRSVQQTSQRANNYTGARTVVCSWRARRRAVAAAMARARQDLRVRIPSKLDILAHRPLVHFHLPTFVIASGVRSARVALLAEKAEVVYNPDEISPDKIVLEITGLGFQAECLRNPTAGGTSILELKVCCEFHRIQHYTYVLDFHTSNLRKDSSDKQVHVTYNKPTIVCLSL